MPSAFLSYSWDSKSHKDWVRKLATDLQLRGVKISLDQWDVHLGMDLTLYMETSVRESDYVILICTPTFAQKANTGRGGVGYEKSVVTGEIFTGEASPEKFVPLLRSGDANQSLPSYLKSRAFVDFSRDSHYADALEQLLRHLHKKPLYNPPPVGRPPDFSSSTKPRMESTVPVIQEVSFEEILEFAYSATGMNKTSSEVEMFVLEWMKNHSSQDFAYFRDIYLFGYSTTGLNKTHAAAEEFAFEVFRQFSKSDFELFRDVCTFAYASDGMNKPHSGAEDFARKWISDFKTYDFERFKSTYKHAYNTTNMSRSGAERVALEAAKGQRVS